MFSSPYVRAVLTHINLRVEETRDETRRVMDCKFVVTPLTPELAAEIGPRVVEQLFTEALHGIDVPRSDVLEIAFDLHPGSQRAGFAIGPDAPIFYTAPDAEIRKVRAKRLDDEDRPSWIELSFLVTMDIPGGRELLRIVEALTAPLYLTFASLQVDLPLGERIVERIVEAATDPENPAVQEFARKMGKRMGRGESVSLQAGNRKITITTEPTKPTA